MVHRCVEVLLQREVFLSRVALLHESDGLFSVGLNTLTHKHDRVYDDYQQRHKDEYQPGPLERFSRHLLGRLTLGYLRDQRATFRAIFIEPVDRNPEATFRTRAQVDALLDHNVSNQHRAHNQYCKNDRHLFRAPSAAASHELLPGRVVEERSHKKDQRRSCGYYQKRRPAGPIGINTQVDEDQRNESADDCVPVISVARSLCGGSVAPDEFVQGPDLFFTRPRAGDTVAHVNRARVAKSFVAVLADCNRVVSLVGETLHRLVRSIDFSLGYNFSVAFPV